jgi:hypothetical protein
VATLVRDLVDPDPAETVEGVRRRLRLVDDPGDDGPYRGPRHPQQFDDGGLGGVLRGQAPVSSKARVWPAPWRAQGNWITVGPCSEQFTRGASASTNERVGDDEDEEE